MKAFVYIGGGIDPAGLDEHPGEGELCIAADSGWRNARRLGVRVNLLVGDMDSLGAEAGSAMAEVEALGGEVMRVPAEKDETDTQLAVHEAVRRGADEIVIVGGLSGRLDHTLANLSVLEVLAEHRIAARITDGRNRVRFLKNDS
ncbi:MAG: thiamine diphosphokinase, partial [Clostridia bacterium]|nr:thiamine diphosphokinase [Clostridia bacterium]